MRFTGSLFEMKNTVKPLMLYVLALSLSIVLIIGGVGYAVWKDQKYQSQWCATLQVLTSKPVPRPSDPAANPSREQAYQLYLDFKDLKNKFGCSS